MLDFYLIDDEIETPDYPEKNDLKKVGSLELKHFEDVQTKGLLSPKFEFYSDFRLNQEEVSILFETIQLKYPEVKDSTLRIESIVQIYDIFKLAVQNKRGLVVYCD